MARFSSSFIQGLANPSYADGLFTAGQKLGGMLSQRAEDKDKAEKEKRATALIQQHKDNPAELRAIAQEYEIKGNQQFAQVFASAAQAALARASKRVDVMNASRAAADARSKAVGTRVDAMGAELERTRLEQNAVKKARATGDKNAVAALVGADKTTLRSYLMQKPGERQTSTLPPGSKLVDTVTGQTIATTPFKPAEPKEAKVNFQKRDDGSILVFKGTELVQTIEPTKAEGDQNAAMNLITKSVYLQGEVDKLSKDMDWESGFAGQVSSMVGGTPGYDRDRDIINLKANLGLDQINEMKRLAAESGASGTGLGQISNIEFMSLQSTVDALDVGMSKEAQLEALANIKKHLKVTQMLASGVAPKDAVDWNSETYKANGYHKDTVTGNVFYAPDGKNGQVYILQNGKFVKARVF